MANGMSGLFSNPWAMMGMGMLAGNQGRTGQGAFSNAMRSGMQGGFQASQMGMLGQMQALQRQQLEQQLAKEEEEKDRRGMLGTLLESEDFNKLPADEKRRKISAIYPKEVLSSMLTSPPTLQRNIEWAMSLPEGDPRREAAIKSITKPQVSVTNVPKPSAGFEYYQTPSGNLAGRRIPGGQADKPSEKQQDVAAYVQNAEVAEKMLGELEGWSPAGAMAAGNPVTRLIAKEEDKRAHDFQLAWTMAVLRAESGAVISPAEAAQQIQVYFEQPGDSAQQAVDKKTLRATKAASMRKRAGKAYEPLSLPQATQAPSQNPEADALMRKYLPQQ